MPISRSPALPVSGAPSYSPNSLPAYRGGVAAAAAWTPADVTVSDSITWEVLDASGTMYGDAAHTTPITANNDPVGAIPTLRGATITQRAYAFWSPRGGNMTYAPVLKTDDATHSRVVEFNAATEKWMLPNGFFDTPGADLLLSENAYMVAIRIKHHVDPTGFTQLMIAGADYSPSVGPGVGVSHYLTPNYVVAAQGVSTTNTGIPRAATGAWSTIVMLCTASGTALYINDPVTPVYTNAGMTPSQWNGKSVCLMSANSTVAFSFRRFIVGSNFNAAEAPIAGVMAWLEG